MNEDYKQYIRSFVPGRLRLRHPGLKGLDGETVATVVETVTAAEGITGCTINPRVGSLVLTWDAKRLTTDDLMGYLAFWQAFIPEVDDVKEETSCGLVDTARSAAAGALDGLAAVIVPKHKGTSNAPRVVQNRLMLGLCAATVGTAYLYKGLHAALGWVFVAFILSHSLQRRKAL